MLIRLSQQAATDTLRHKLPAGLLSSGRMRSAAWPSSHPPRSAHDDIEAARATALPLRERTQPASSHTAGGGAAAASVYDDEKLDDRHPSEESVALLVHRCVYLSCPILGTIVVLFVALRYLFAAGSATIVAGTP